MRMRTFLSRSIGCLLMSFGRVFGVVGCWVFFWGVLFIVDKGGGVSYI